MPINQNLLQKLQSNLGVKAARVYALVAEKASATALPRELAVFLVAKDAGINYQKFATPAQLSQVRAAINGIAAPADQEAAPAIQAQMPRPLARQKGKRGPRIKENSVFVVHGRDEGLRKSMFGFLRALGLNPIEWSKAVLLPKKGGGNPHVDEIVASAMAQAQAVVVIFSPDDLAQLRPELIRKGESASEGKLQGQPRPNVFFETGLALGRYPAKTLLIQIGTLRGFSDIEGMHLVRLTNAFEKRQDVANRLEKIGCTIDRRGTDWHDTGDFVPHV